VNVRGVGGVVGAQVGKDVYGSGIVGDGWATDEFGGEEGLSETVGINCRFFSEFMVLQARLYIFNLSSCSL